MLRNLCKICNKKPVAINYYKDNKVFYRSKCDHCSKKRKTEKPIWSKIGYIKKTECDRCGFKSKHPEQFNIFYVDGNPSNYNPKNLKSICANCQCIIYKLKLTWNRGDLTPDF